MWRLGSYLLLFFPIVGYAHWTGSTHTHSYPTQSEAYQAFISPQGDGGTLKYCDGVGFGQKGTDCRYHPIYNYYWIRDIGSQDVDIYFAFTSYTSTFSPSGEPAPECSQEITTNCHYDGQFYEYSPLVVQDCSAGQYRPGSGGPCQQIPNCFEGSDGTGGDFFNINTLQCEKDTSSLVTCSQPNTLWCPATNDCAVSSTICTDNPADLQAHSDSQQSITPVKQSDAGSAAFEASDIHDTVTTIKDALETQVQNAQSNYDAALAAYELDPSLANAASLQVSIQELTDVQARSGTVGISHSSSGLAKSNSQNVASQIDSNTPPGIAENLAAEAEYWRQEAERAYQAALNNTAYSAGNYPSPGTVPAGGYQPPGSEADDDSIPNQPGVESEYSIPEVEGHLSSAERLVNAWNDYPAVAAVDTIRNLDFSPAYQCPALVLDTTSAWFGELSTSVHCDLINDHINYIQSVFVLVWSFTAFMLFFEA